jgi:hypothetical protein
MVETAKVHCSWCLYNVFIPLSDKIVKCYNCNNLKCVGDGVEMEPKTYEDYDDDVDY